MYVLDTDYETYSIHYMCFDADKVIHFRKFLPLDTYRQTKSVNCCNFRMGHHIYPLSYAIRGYYIRSQDIGTTFRPE